MASMGVASARLAEMVARVLAIAVQIGIGSCHSLRTGLGQTTGVETQAELPTSLGMEVLLSDLASDLSIQTLSAWLRHHALLGHLSLST